VLQASSVASRLEALHAAGLTALVGREEEFELLRRCSFKATGGEGQVVLLSGEAGIGKSRLTSAFLGLLAGEPHLRLGYCCSPLLSLKPTDRSTVARDVVGPLAKATVKAFPKTPCAAWGSPGRYPARSRRATPSTDHCDRARPPMARLISTVLLIIHFLDRALPFTAEGFLMSFTHRPVKTAVRRSTKDLIPSFASSLFITRSRIFGTTAIAACSPASMNLRPASLVT